MRPPLGRACISIFLLLCCCIWSALTPFLCFLKTLVEGQVQGNSSNFRTNYGEGLEGEVKVVG